MSLPREAEEQLKFLDTLKAEQSKVLLAGRFNVIEEYKAGCAVLRNLDRLRESLNKIYAGAMAAEVLADMGLQELHNPKDDAR